MFTGRLLVRFLLWLAPCFLLVAGAGFYVVVERDLRWEADTIVARVGNHAGRVAVVLARNEAASNGSLAADLMSSLLADRAVRCAELWDGDRTAMLATVPVGLACGEHRADHKLDIPVDDSAGTQLLIRLDFGEVSEARRNRRDLAFLALLFGFAVAVGASLLAFRQTIGTPLRKLLVAIRATAETGRVQRVENKSHDELGLVIDSYNGMQEKLGEESARVRLSLAEIEHLYHSTPAPMFCVDDEGRVTETSAYWLEFSGFDRKDVVGQPIQLFLRLPKGISGGAELIRSVAADADRRDCEVMIRRKDGREIDSLLAVSRRDAAIGGYLCVATDISHLRKAERELRRVAVTDRLTGLPNRAAIPDLASQLVRRLRPREKLALLYVDLDNFKQVNDTFGHEAGDRLIIEVVGRMAKIAGPESPIVRLGGDEFLVITSEDRTDRRSLRMAEMLIAELARAIDVGAGIGFVSSSIGVAYLDRGDCNWSEGIRHADLAMYQAKQDGKNRYAVYTAQLGEQLGARAGRAIMIRQGLEAGWFSLAYQPIVRLADFRPVGAEALLRLQRPSLPPEPTQAVIQTAEETGQIERIGEWVLSEALGKRGEAGGVVGGGRYLSVNLSARQLNPKTLLALRHRLDRTGFPPDCLVVEITETAVIRRFEEAATVLAEIRKLGVRVALDDFGTGYSSLSYIGRLPVDIIKLDRSITKGLADSDSRVAARRTAAALVRSVTTLANDLGIAMVAEGIEDMEVAATLAHLGVTHGQGHLFSPPLPESAFRDWMSVFDPASLSTPPMRRRLAVAG